MSYIIIFVCVLSIVFCSIIPNIGSNVINKKTSSAYELPDVGIIGGKEAKPGMFPYIVSLQTNEGIPSHFCGGSLISQRYVLTAANCVRKSRDFHVRIGVHNLMNKNETIQRIGVSKVIMHPEFVKEMPGSANDIALIKLDQLVDFKIIKGGFGSTSKIGLSRRFVPIDTKLTIAGWGAAEFPARRTSPFLKHDNYKLLNIYECPEAYLRDNGRGTYCVETGNSTNSPFCGDSGGPCLENDDQNKISLVGIVSYLSNAKKVGPLIVWKNVVCTKISNYLDWVESVTGPLS